MLKGRGLSRSAASDANFRDTISRLLFVAAIAFLMVDFVAQYAGASEFIRINKVSRFELGYLTVGYLIPNVLLTATAVSLIVAGRRNPAAALLALTLLEICSTQLFAEDFWKVENLLWVGLLIERVASLGLTASLLIFPDGTFYSSWGKRLAIAACLYAVVISISQLPTTETWPADAAVQCFAAIALGTRLRIEQGSKAHQILCVWLGVGLFILGYSLFYLIGPACQRSSFEFIRRLPGYLLALGILSLGAGIMVAVLRYRLFDLNRVISRSVIYALLVGGAGVLFEIAEGGLDVLLKTYLPVEGIRRHVMLVFAACFTAPFLASITRWADRRFRAPLLNLKDSLPRWLSEVVRFASEEETLSEAAAWVGSAVRSEHVAILTGADPLGLAGLGRGDVRQWSDEHPLEYDEVVTQDGDWMFPMRVPLRINPEGKGSVVGWLLVGRRRDGSAYAPDEIQALKEVSGPLARTIRELRQRDSAAP
jgi:hypothetical protein